ncbi:MAG: sugar ABC transporter permease [Chthoniobacterales bacterium]|nr:sugar ABC transporter permease [Chthoniobacterales bacterium]
MQTGADGMGTPQRGGSALSRTADATRAAALASITGWDPVARRRAFLSVCLAPALVFLALAMVYPLFYNVLLSFSDAENGRIREWHYVGLRQYALVFLEPGFWFTFCRTVVWTVVSTGLQAVIGVFLAIILNQHFVRGRSAWRALLLLPWAMPQYITALTWQGMFHGHQGTVNSFLGAAFGLPPVEWLTHPFAAFTAAIAVNVWMGYPFLMIAAFAGLRAVPPSIYESAMLEGATPWQQFTNLTLPLLRSVMLPATVIAIIWNFNSLNVVWLFTNGGEPADSTHILVSYVYKTAFTYYRFGWSAALSVVIFVILFFFVQTFLKVNRWRG